MSSRKSVNDPEIAMITRHMRDYAMLPPERRASVHQYIGERLNNLPVIAAVNGGIEQDAQTLPLFPVAPTAAETV